MSVELTGGLMDQAVECLIILCVATIVCALAALAQRRAEISGIVGFCDPMINLVFAPDDNRLYTVTGCADIASWYASPHRWRIE